MPSDWRRRAGRACRPPRAALLLLSAVLLSVAVLPACAAKRIAVSGDETTPRSVTIIDGVAPAQPPPDPRFASFSPLQAEASLRRVIVRPSRLVAANRLDPQPLLVGEELEWARDVIAAELPKLKPNQRLELHFPDRLNQFDVTVQVYGVGPDLVYRFELLATPPHMPDEPGVAGERASFAALEPQAGQQIEGAYRVPQLRDPVFAGQGSGEALARVLGEVQGRVDAKRLSPADVAPIEQRLRQQRDLPLLTVRLYLDKLETISRALEQNLFSEQEAAARRQALLDALPVAKP